MHEQHEVNVPKEKFLGHEQPKTPIEVLSSNLILINVAQKDLKVSYEVFDARDAGEEDIDHTCFKPYVLKSHCKKMKPENGNNEYNT